MFKTVESEAHKLINSNRRELQEMAKKVAEVEGNELPKKIVKLETGMVDFKIQTTAFLEKIGSHKMLTPNEGKDLLNIGKERLNLIIEVDNKMITWIGQLDGEKLLGYTSNSEIVKKLSEEKPPNLFVTPLQMAIDELNKEISTVREIIRLLDISYETMELKLVKKGVIEFREMMKTRKFD